MQLSQYLVALARDGKAFANVVADTLDRPVPSCPDWTNADLTFHLGSVFHFWADMVEHRHTDPSSVVRSLQPDDAHLVEWFRRQLARLERVLATADPTAVHWTWSTEQNTAFVIRRMAQETGVHLWDAQFAAGAPQPIDARLAEDGVDEFVVHFSPWRRKDAPAVGGRIEFVIAETGHVVRTEGLGDPDAFVTGTASDLLLALWRRIPLDRVAVDGDAGVVARFIEGVGLD